MSESNIVSRGIQKIIQNNIDIDLSTPEGVQNVCNWLYDNHTMCTNHQIARVCDIRPVVLSLFRQSDINSDYVQKNWKHLSKKLNSQLNIALQDG